MSLVRLLHLLPPEAAHHAAIRGLAVAPNFRPKPALSLAMDIAGLALPHPIGLAAGFDKNAEAYRGLLRLGFAFVEIGTVTPQPQEGNPRPRLFRLTEDQALINRMGFNNEGLDEVARRLAGRDMRAGFVGANLGMNKDAPDPLSDYLAGLERLYPLADYVAINVSSPNTPGLRALQKADRLGGLVGPLVRRRDELAPAYGRKLVFLKIAPDLEEADEEAIAAIALETGIDGLIVSNTTVARPPGLISRHKGETGGLSGPPLFELSTHLLARMAQRLAGRLPLIGVGGVRDAATAYAKIRAGASAVQLYTGLIYEGPFLARRIVSALPALLERDGFSHISKAVGVDIDKLTKLDRRKAPA